MAGTIMIVGRCTSMVVMGMWASWIRASLQCTVQPVWFLSEEIGFSMIVQILRRGRGYYTANSTRFFDFILVRFVLEFT